MSQRFQWLVIALLVTAVGVQGYYLRRTWVFGKAVGDYLGYLSDGVDCSIGENGNDRNDTYLAAQGKTREDLVGTPDEKWLPVRPMYDTHIPACKAFFESKCWVLSVDNADKCGEHFGLTKEQIETYKKTGVYPK